MTYLSAHARRIYRAEDWAQSWADHGTVDAYGSRWTVEPVTTIATITGAETLCHLLTGIHGLPPVTVRARRGWIAAHYEPATQTIALPPATAPWSELLLIHEVAHHATTNETADHGPRFRHTLVSLIASAGMPNLAHLLAIRFAEDGLGYTPPVEGALP